MRLALALLMFMSASTAAVAQDSKQLRWDFEDAQVGTLPDGWTASKTGKGEGSVWKVVEDRTSPAASRVLAQTAAGPRPLFNVCVTDAALQDLEISAAFKAIDGAIDQGGGLVWRYRDENNYYIARYNPLEQNLRVYRVADGKRQQLDTEEGIDAAAGNWHTLTVTMRGDAIECSLNGEKLLEAKDSTFAEAGSIGLWTKADARTYFDQLQAQAIK